MQNRPSCQKILCLELGGDDAGAIQINDLTTAKIIDRSAPITAFRVSESDGLIALVYDQMRITVYDSLQKEIVKKYRQGNGKVKDIAFT